MKYFTFQQLRGNEFFNFLGISVGRILTEGEDIFLVLSQEHAARILEDVLGRDDFLPDNPEVLRIMEEVKQAGILPTFDHVIKAIMEKKLPQEDHRPKESLVFQRCTTCEMQVPHGHIYYRGERGYKVTNLLKGLTKLSRAVTEDVITPETAVFLFQQMVNSGLLPTADEFEDELKKLHPDLSAYKDLEKAFVDFLATTFGSLFKK